MQARRGRDFDLDRNFCKVDKNVLCQDYESVLDGQAEPISSSNEEASDDLVTDVADDPMEGTSTQNTQQQWGCLI